MDIKKIVIAFAVLLMLSGGTISVMKWMEVGPFAPVDETAEAEKEAEPEVPPIDIPLDSLIIPVFSGNEVIATVVIGVKLQVKGTENEEKITKILPRLSDGFLRDLYAFIPRVISKQRKLNAEILSGRMKLIGDKIAGPNILHKVVVESMNEQ